MAIPIKRLSPREREIVHLYAEEALTDKEIAERLGISVKTVGVHWWNMTNKIGAANTRETRMMLLEAWDRMGFD